MDYHVTPEEVAGFVLDRLPKERTRAVILHLLQGCKSCRALLEPNLPVLFSSWNCSQEVSPPLSAAYDEAMDRAFDAFGLRVPRKTLEESRQEALELLTSGGLEALDALPPDLVGQPMIEALLEWSWSLRFEDPKQMVRLALAATLAAGRQDEWELGTQATEDLRCRAWIELSNAYRVADELDLAENAFSRARDHLMEGTYDGLLGARYFVVAGSLYTARRNFGMARISFDIATNLYSEYGDEHLAGRSRIMKGIAIGFSGDTEEAIHNVRLGLSTVVEERDSMLVLIAKQCEARFLADCGRFHDALCIFGEAERLGLSAGGHLNLLKIRWLEGQIQAGLDELDSAELSLSEVRQGFEEAGLGYKAALVGMELAMVLMRQGRIEEGERTARECAEVFFSLQLQRELHASALLLQAAVEMRQLKLTTLYEVIDRLR